MLSTHPHDEIKECKLYIRVLIYIIFRFISHWDFNFSLPNNIIYNSADGYALSNSIYANLAHFSGINGSVIYLNFRLFTPWQGKAPLYVFVIFIKTMESKSIIQRFPVEPQRNTTNWQTIPIALHALQIRPGAFLGIGMQHTCDTNKLYNVINTLGTFHAKNITPHVIDITRSDYSSSGIAFSYTVARYH